MSTDDRIRRLESLRAENSAAHERAVDRQHERGKHTARERIEMLVDKDSFQEIDAWVRLTGRERQLLMLLDDYVNRRALEDGKPRSLIRLQQREIRHLMTREGPRGVIILEDRPFVDGPEVLKTRLVQAG